MIDPDRACPHEDFAATVEVNRLSTEDGGPINAYSADVRVQCVQCGEPFRFRCLDAGVLPEWGDRDDAGERNYGP